MNAVTKCISGAGVKVKDGVRGVGRKLFGGRDVQKGKGVSSVVEEITPRPAVETPRVVRAGAVDGAKNEVGTKRRIRFDVDGYEVMDGGLRDLLEKVLIEEIDRQVRGGSRDKELGAIPDWIERNEVDIWLRRVAERRKYPEYMVYIEVLKYAPGIHISPDIQTKLESAFVRYCKEKSLSYYLVRCTD